MESISKQILFPVIFSLAQLALLGWVDYVTGYEISLVVFYFLPIASAAWKLGAAWGGVFAVASAITLTWTEVAAGRSFSQWWMVWEHGVMRALVFGFVAFSFGYFRRSIDLERGRVRRLEGLLTFCNCCMRVQDDQGNWDDLPTVVRRNKDVQTRLKVCPQCSRVAFVDRPTNAGADLVRD